MFSVSQLSMIVSTVITITIFLVAVAAVTGGVTFTSIRVHSKRSATKKNLLAKDTKNKVKNVSKVKTVSKNVNKTKTVKKAQTREQIRTTMQQAPKMVYAITEFQPDAKPVVDKSKLIGEEKVNAEDLKTSSTHKWAYRIILNSSTNPENNAELSWKTSDRASIIDSLIQDTKLTNYQIVNKCVDYVNWDLKYIDEKGQPKTCNKEYSVTGNVLGVKQFRNDAKELLDKVSIVQVKTNENTEDQEYTQIL